MSKDVPSKESRGGKDGGKVPPYLQNRELSWLAFNQRCLDQGADKTVPLLERMNFVSIFWSNLQEFFMVRVGSLTDLSLLKKTIIDSKSLMTPAEQIAAIHKRCHELYPQYERTFSAIETKLAGEGIVRRTAQTLTSEQREFVRKYAQADIVPYLAPQVVNALHPFPHLENGAIYVITSLAPLGSAAGKASKEARKQTKGAQNVTLGIIPVPARCERIIRLPGDGFQYLLVEHAIELIAPDVFSMYATKGADIICVTRNADLDALEGIDEEVDLREHMKKILKRRGRLAPVRLEFQRKPMAATELFLQERLGLTSAQCYVSAVPLDMGYVFSLASRLGEGQAAKLCYKPFTPAWPRMLSATEPVFDQVQRHDVLVTYPYESMNAFLQLIRESVYDPDVVSIKITLYRLATKSRLAELLISAAEAGKDVTVLFELRARFDEANNIEWSQRCEEAGCKVVYGFRDYKVHSKLCLITRKTANGMEYVTQIGTGNYNEKTAALYTDYCLMTADKRIGNDALEFFQNIGLEAVTDTYDHLLVAPVQIKPFIIQQIDHQIALAKNSSPCGLFLKENSITDQDIIGKLCEASQAGVPVTLFVRGICCIVPGIKGCTDNIRVVSVVGRLLEHHRVYIFGPLESSTCKVYISSADLMTRNMERRVEIACPIFDEQVKAEIIRQMQLYLNDTVKLRELKPDRTFTGLRETAHRDENGKKIRLDAQKELIKWAQGKPGKEDERDMPAEREDEAAAEAPQAVLEAPETSPAAPEATPAATSETSPAAPEAAPTPETTPHATAEAPEVPSGAAAVDASTAPAESAAESAVVLEVVIADAPARTDLAPQEPASLPKQRGLARLLARLFARKQ